MFMLIHRFKRNLFWKINYLLEKLFGTKFQEMKFARRPLSLNDCWGGKDHPHRQLLIKKISAFSPIFNILEIGCSFGPNLYLIAKKFPNAEITGIDINSEAIKVGNQWFEKENIPNVKLLLGKADKLNRFENKSFDIIFADSVLMYIGPDKIKKVIKEMLRISRKAIILVEWHENLERKDPQGLGVYHFGHWKRNYEALLNQFVPKDKIILTKISQEICPGEDWRKFGYFIEVILKKRK